jgi:hypothetical protein
MLDPLSLGVLIGETRARVIEHDRALRALTADLARIKERLQRLAILAVLWALGLAANADPERLAELLAALFKAAKL